MESEEEWRFSYLRHWGSVEVELIKIILGEERFLQLALFQNTKRWRDVLTKTLFLKYST